MSVALAGVCPKYGFRGVPAVIEERTWTWRVVAVGEKSRKARREYVDDAKSGSVTKSSAASDARGAEWGVADRGGWLPSGAA